MRMKKVTSKKITTNNKKKPFRKHTFKFAECVSMLDVLESTAEHVGLLMYVADKIMGVREREITSCKHYSNSK